MSEDLYQRQIHERGPLEPWEIAHESRRQHYRRQAARARYAVRKAIARGDLLALPHPGVFCVDCGAPAAAYDHRDYDRPLDVRAVCDPCNAARGPAKHAPPFVERVPIDGGDDTYASQELCQSY